MPRCGIAGREIENRKVLQGVVNLKRCSSFFLGSCQKMLICDKLGRKCEVQVSFFMGKMKIKDLSMGYKRAERLTWGAQRKCAESIDFTGFLREKLT